MRPPSELIEAIERLEALSPMKCRVVSTEAEYLAVVAEMGAAGLRIAAISNAGLPDPQRRLTFLPQSAFRDAPQGS